MKFVINVSKHITEMHHLCSNVNLDQVLIKEPHVKICLYSYVVRKLFNIKVFFGYLKAYKQNPYHHPPNPKKYKIKKIINRCIWKTSFFGENKL